MSFVYQLRIPHTNTEEIKYKKKNILYVFFTHIFKVVPYIKQGQNWQIANHRFLEKNILYVYFTHIYKVVPYIKQGQNWQIANHRFLEA